MDPNAADEIKLDNGEKPSVDSIDLRFFDGAEPAGSIRWAGIDNDWPDARNFVEGDDGDVCKCGGHGH